MDYSYYYTTTDVSPVASAGAMATLATMFATYGLIMV